MMITTNLKTRKKEEENTTTCLFFHILSKSLFIKFTFVSKLWYNKIFHNHSPPTLDDDDIILFHILNQLPPKSLLRFSCVSKLWYNTIHHDPFFIESHFNRLFSSQRRHRVTLGSNQSTVLFQYIIFFMRAPFSFLCLFAKKSTSMLNRMRTTCINCFRPRVDNDEDGSTRGDSPNACLGSRTAQLLTGLNEGERDANLDSVEGGSTTEKMDVISLSDHHYGQYSTAETRVKNPGEVFGQVINNGASTFVGIYDGHHGSFVASYLYTHLYTRYIEKKIKKSGGAISETLLFDAFGDVEEVILHVMDIVSEMIPADAVNASSYATVGSSCLVGIIYDNKLFVANLGDSRAVMGSLDASSQLHLNQLTTEHSLRNDQVKEQMLESNPDDVGIVLHNKVKGKMVTTKSIGDLYLKRVESSDLPGTHDRFKFTTPLRRPALSAVPDVSTIPLDKTNKFLIFASYGFWNFITNERAAQLVVTCPHKDIAKTLVREALVEAGRRANPPCSYETLLKHEDRIRMQVVDMAVVVIFFAEDGLPGIERGTENSAATTSTGTTSTGAN